MRILFSPVGNTDPWRGEVGQKRDGAMLHIVRHYQPQKVVLWFTESIWEFGHKNYEWESIIQRVVPNCQVTIHISKNSKPHDFDSFKYEFHDHIKTIIDENPGAEILLNVTSGTPQMGASLCLEYVTFPENKKCLQVSTYRNGTNAGTGYSKPENQEADFLDVQQNEQDAASRCREIDILIFHEMKIRNQFYELIEGYDYVAAKKLLISDEAKGIRNRQATLKKLEPLVDAVQHFEILPDIKAAYPNKQKLVNALCHYLLLALQLEQGDTAEVLIRAKSIAEYLGVELLKKHNPEMIYKSNGRYYFEPNYQPFYDRLESRLKKKFWSIREPYEVKLVSLYHAFLTEPELNAYSSYFLDIEAINDYRNMVAHQLKNLNYKENELVINQLITKAVNAVKSLLLCAYPEIDRQHFDFFDNQNKELKKLYD